MKFCQIAQVSGAIFASIVAMPAAAQTPVSATECTAATARTTSIAALTGEDGPRVGDCVTVEGIRVGWELHADNAARYRQQLVYNTPSSSGAIIGLAGTPLSRAAGDVAPQMVRVTGRVESCATRRIRLGVGTLVNPTDEQRMTFLTGFCEQTNGLLIDVTAQTALDAVLFTRIPRGGADVTLGNLVPLTDLELHRFMLQLGVHFLRTVQSRDRAALITLLRPLGENPRTDADAAVLADAVLGPDTPFAAFTPTQEPIIEVFGWRQPAWADATWELERLDPSQPREAIVCMSVHRDGAALMPIDSSDADNRPGRPYACTRIMVRNDNQVSFDPSRQTEGATEPE